MSKDRLMIMDAGERREDVKLYDDASGTTKVLSQQEYIDLPLQSEYEGIPHSQFDNVWYGTEQAHAVPRTRYSLAHLFKETQLQQLLTNCTESENFTLCTFSERLTSRALHYVKGSKDADDTRALATLISHFDLQPHFKKVKYFNMSPRMVVCNQQRTEVFNPQMNAAQAWNYGLIKKGESYLDLDLCPVTRDWILPHAEAISKISDWVKYFFSFDTVKPNRLLSYYPDVRPDITEARDYISVTKKKGGEIEVKDWAFDMRGIYAVMNGLFDYDGNFRIDPITGQLAGNNYLKDAYFVESQFHQQGGVGRAILNNYVFPCRVGDLWDHYKGVVKTKGKQANLDLAWLRFTNSSYNRGDLSPEQDAFLVQNRKHFKRAYRDILGYFRNFYF